MSLSGVRVRLRIRMGVGPCVARVARLSRVLCVSVSSSFAVVR